MLAMSLTFINVSYAAQNPNLTNIDALMQKHEYIKALETTNAELATNPKNVELLHIRIVLYKLTKHPEKASADFAQLITLTKDDAHKHSLMAYRDAYFGNFTEAKKHIDEAIQLDPKKSDYYSDRAEILIDQSTSNSAAALKDIDKALELNANSFAAYFARARIYAKLGEKQKSAADFATAQKLKKEFVNKQ